MCSLFVDATAYERMEIVANFASALLRDVRATPPIFVVLETRFSFTVVSRVQHCF